MNASSKLPAIFSVTGLSLAFSLGFALPSQAQQPPENSGSAYRATQSSAAATSAAPLQTASPVPNGIEEALLKARQALASGDNVSAERFAKLARQFSFDPSTAPDTPDRVLAMINRHAQLIELDRQGQAEAFNYSAAVFLIEQADQLLLYRDFETANQLLNTVGDFEKMGVQYKQGDMQPGHVRAKIKQLMADKSTLSAAEAAQLAEAGKILSEAQLALDKGQLDLASQLVAQVNALNLPESAFNNDAIRPWDLELKISRAQDLKQSNVAQVGYQDSAPSKSGVVQQADYYPELDTTRNAQVSGVEANENESPFQPTGTDRRGQQLYDSGISALTNNDREGALRYFNLAWQYRDQLNASARQDLQSKLSQLNAGSNSLNANFAQEEIQGTEQDLRQKMATEVFRQRAVAQRMLDQNNPRGAMAHMRLLRDDVIQSDLDEAGKTQLTRVIDREINEYGRYIEQNLSLIQNHEQNESRLAAVDQDRQNRVDIDRKIQSLVNDFNQLIDEERYSEAEFIARQARDLAPDNVAVVAMNTQITLQKNSAEAKRLEERYREGNVALWQAEDKAKIANVTTDIPIDFNENTWERIRNRKAPGTGDNLTERERVIWSALKGQQFTGEFNRTPLEDVLRTFSEAAGVNIILDQRALDVEEVSSDSPVTAAIRHPISIESALNLILGNVNLVFKIENESVLVTNRQALQASPKVVTYYVGDLVVPIPDFSGNPLNMEFVPTNRQSGGPVAGNGGFGANQNGVDAIPVSYNAQQSPSFSGGSLWTGAALQHGPQRTEPIYSTWGAKSVGQGGITAQDFTQLIDLLQETIDPDSWELNGGNGRLRPFPSTLSLIVTQTQENQDRISSLLARLRELNDVQIVVEVRFLTLTDDFFERIGIDLDLAFNDNSGFTPATLPDSTSGVGGTAVIGRLPLDPGVITPANLDIPITQGSFGSTIPTISTAGDLATTGLNLGFAILSDIEVFFLLQAAKGDNRSNTTQAPTVTMFNGQAASVFSGAQTPFVTSVQPIVGDFAAAQQPIITVLPEGTQLNVRAVASADRRFVRMTLVPFFSEIQEVTEFTFDGESSVTQGGVTALESILDAITGAPATPDDALAIVNSGTTVQLPVFANTTAQTTVSVPDGGTVLLGGVKTLVEERLETGVPFLSNIPYVNRLFKNVGISRATSSEMLMVTPRIIIQEEEEENQINAN